jgi:predicted naringenin-chalcone synthase
MFISDFTSYAPPYRTSQSKALDWLGQAHARRSLDIDAAKFTKLFQRYGCGPDRIESRASFLSDFTHSDWERMRLFNKDKVSLDERMRFFNEALVKPIAKLYGDRPLDFRQWIHVTCTGYSSPSAVQSFAAQAGWGERLEILHAYHMGCYASLPALRMARGNLDADVLHTELCTLHFDPANHNPEQLVVQSLFADGVIRYRVSAQAPVQGFEVLDLKEVISPGTLEHMTWEVSGQGFRMTLNRDVPKKVEAAVGALVAPWRETGTLYAIHPGGPRIIDAVKEALELSEEQVFFSKEILRRHGNMSSATLPHIWSEMLTEIPSGTRVVSMAFGPGLTISAGLMRKV